MQVPIAADAERAVLGSMLIEPRVIPAVMSIITTSAMFHSEANAVVYDHIARLDGIDERADLVTLKASMDASDVLLPVGGFNYVHALVASTPSPVGVERYAGIVREKWVARELQSELETIARSAGHAPASELIGRVEAVASRLFDSGPSESASWRDAVREVADRVGSGVSIPATPTHFLDVDHMLGGGLRASEMIVIGARPSMGKSALMQNMAENMAIGGMPRSMRNDEVPVGVFSLEMSQDQLAARSISRWSSVSLSMLRRGEGGCMIGDASRIVSEAPIYIDDTETTIGGIRAKARQMVRTRGVGVIFIDYLQLIGDPAASRHGQQEEVSSISKQVKQLAKSLHIPVVALCQLNRQVEGQANHRPRMKDLRGSGSIEQDADVILLLHREDYYDDQAAPGAILDVAKQRNGPTGVITLGWDPECMRFLNLDRHHQEGQ